MELVQTILPILMSEGVLMGLTILLSNSGRTIFALTTHLPSKAMNFFREIISSAEEPAAVESTIYWIRRSAVQNYSVIVIKLEICHPETISSRSAKMLRIRSLTVLLKNVGESTVSESYWIATKSSMFVLWINCTILRLLFARLILWSRLFCTYCLVVTYKPVLVRGAAVCSVSN